MKTWKGLPVLVAMAAGPGLLRPAQPTPSALKAWDDYLSQADSRFQARLEGKQPFLWIDEAPDRAARLRQGEVLAEPLGEHGIERAANGLIHHWIGAVFIPGATADELLSVLDDYDRYKDFYKPLVIDSHTLSFPGNEQEFSMVWKKHVLFLTVVMEGQYQSRDVLLGAGRGYTVSDSTRVQQIDDYGSPDERRLPEGTGFIWRLHSLSRYEERDGGVYLEMEAFALTRDIPASLRWLVAPLVTRLSVNSVTTCLRQTRDAVEAAAASSHSSGHHRPRPLPTGILTGGPMVRGIPGDWPRFPNSR